MGLFCLTACINSLIMPAFRFFGKWDFNGGFSYPAPMDMESIDILSKNLQLQGVGGHLEERFPGLKVDLVLILKDKCHYF